jgi:DNA ligase-1
MTDIKKPMLAPNDEFDADTCKFPKQCSPKIDGFRAFNQDGVMYTRSGKPIANEFTQSLFSRIEFSGLDGELVVGEPNHPDVFNNSQGPLRRKEGDPGARWFIFDDRTDPTLPFEERIQIAHARVFQMQREGVPGCDRLVALPHIMIHDKDHLDQCKSDNLKDGYEGTMLRDPQGVYKFGRATYKEQLLLKVKDLVHEEGTILYLEEQMINENEAFKDELGRTKRSQHSENMVPSGMAGAVWMKNDKWPEPFKISLGSVTHEEKKRMWACRDHFVGCIGAYKYFGYGSINAPRQGVWKGLRSPDDMGE